MKRYHCVCCNHATLEASPPGTYQICPLCHWEDDEFQFLNPNYAGGANALSLNQAREQYKKEEKAAYEKNFL